jgi:acyl-ACP thioesterase
MERRVASLDARVGLGDVRPDARMRLDAIARVVQDVADHDAATASIDGMGVWILRRLALDIAHTPKFRARLTAHTWCSGVGARWAERTTTVGIDDVRCIDATAIWVHVDPQTGAPTRLPTGFDTIWGATARDRRVSARLTHRLPSPDAHRAPWVLRATDIDVMRHVNNAAYWAVAEDELAGRGAPHVAHAEIEFRAGIDPDDDVTTITEQRTDGFALWLTVDDDVRASMLVGCTS